MPRSIVWGALANSGKGLEVVGLCFEGLGGFRVLGSFREQRHKARFLAKSVQHGSLAWDPVLPEALVCRAFAFAA